MSSVKKVLSILMILVMGIFVSCTKSEETQTSKIDLFDYLKGKNLAKEYLVNIRSGNMDKANELCDKELVDKSNNLSQGVSNITGFQLDKNIVGSDFAYYIFNIIRDSSTEPKSDLESYTIKIKRDNDAYSISEVNAKPQRQLYINNNNALRIIGEKGGKSSLIISLNNIPKDTYLRNNKLMLYKEKVPSDSFGKVVLGFTGKKVAVSTIDNVNSYICIIYIDDTLMEGGTDEVSPGKPSESSAISELQETFEKPVSNKVVSIDLLNNTTIEDFIFSKEDDNLAVNYKDSTGVNRVNIYKAEDGEIIDNTFNESFPQETYNIKAEYFDENKLIINVYKKDNSKDEITGEYSLNLKNKEMIKL